MWSALVSVQEISVMDSIKAIETNTLWTFDVICRLKFLVQHGGWSMLHTGHTVHSPQRGQTILASYFNLRWMQFSDRLYVCLFVRKSCALVQQTIIQLPHPHTFPTKNLTHALLVKKMYKIWISPLIYNEFMKYFRSRSEYKEKLNENVWFSWLE